MAASVLLPFCFRFASVMQVKVHVMEVPCLAGFPQISTCSSNQFAAPVCFRSASVFRRSLRASRILFLTAQPGAMSGTCHVRDIAASPVPRLCLASVLLPFCFRFASVMLVKLILFTRVKMCRETAKGNYEPGFFLTPHIYIYMIYIIIFYMQALAVGGGGCAPPPHPPAFS